MAGERKSTSIEATKRKALVAESKEIGPGVFHHRQRGVFLTVGPRGGTRAFETAESAFASIGLDTPPEFELPDPSSGRVKVPLILSAIAFLALGLLAVFRAQPDPAPAVQATLPVPAPIARTTLPTSTVVESPYYSCRPANYDAANCAAQKRSVESLGRFLNLQNGR